MVKWEGGGGKKILFEGRVKDRWKNKKPCRNQGQQGHKKDGSPFYSTHDKDPVKRPHKEQAGKHVAGTGTIAAIAMDGRCHGVSGTGVLIRPPPWCFLMTGTVKS